MPKALAFILRGKETWCGGTCLASQYLGDGKQEDQEFMVILGFVLSVGQTGLCETLPQKQNIITIGTCMETSVMNFRFFSNLGVFLYKHTEFIYISVVCSVSLRQGPL